jgi:putative nucleotidyltransferase with HDIG domain
MGDPQAPSAGDRLGQQLEAVVLKRLAEDKLVLPPMPSVATKCLEVIQKSDFSINKVADLIESDPILAARLMRTVNSAGMATKAPATNLQAAVMRLGQKNLRTVLLEASVGTVFESRDRRISEAAKAVWQHSVAVALLARDVGILLGVPEPEDAYLTGLLHDVGKPVLAILLLEAEKQVTIRTTKPWIGSDEWMKCLQRSHRAVGVALAKRWSLPESVVNAIEQCSDYDSTERHSIANVVRFSNAICKQQGLYVGDFDPEDINALVMIGRSLLGMEDDGLVRLVSGLKDKVANRFKS